MTTGIYKLKFSDGSLYIGKSKDIDQRMRQHAAKFVKGIHSEQMQCAFDRMGTPKASVVFECHENHLEIMEAFFINLYKGQKLLNTIIPEDPFPGKWNDTDVIAILESLVKKSLLDICLEYMKQTRDIEALNAYVTELVEDNRVLSEDRTAEEVIYDVHNNIQELKSLLTKAEEREKELLLENESLSDQVIALSNRLEAPWYKRLFGF